MSQVYKNIKNDHQIWKFCFYGLLKNLKFFEPYLLIYLLGMGFNLFKIGILFSIREVITYIFEVPSGIFADHYGKKKELMICFTFYIISFVFFFIGKSFYNFVIGMIFFGLGEAFRSGTHKAMIYTYLEQKGWFEHKAFVYGRTRSFSLIGSAISAFLSILFILNLPSARWIFLICIIPYIIDFILIWSYPDSLDERRYNVLNLKKFFIESFIQLKNIIFNTSLNKILISSSLYDGIFKTIKDYIQLILKLTIITSAASSLKVLEGENMVKIYLGITYGIFYICSSMASKNVYKLNKITTSNKLLVVSFDVMAILLLFLSIAIKNNNIMIIIGIFFVLYILKDARRPIFVDVCGDYMEKNQRATVLSVDSQLRSLFTVIFAPIFGFVADHYSIGTLFLLIGILILIVNRFLYVPKQSLQIR
ncbi:MFS transporter [Crassaminicella thermophila]|uniref:MFS transporter n=1 Tax=Crassaminicella thermophila TaxID=2599308 RepID=A0A5C0SEC8_CRATE|nr:MFS transporter [Crassaminicella thermophila]QEK12975.1 MFS transporter [Crassaminicella thermophila]